MRQPADTFPDETVRIVSVGAIPAGGGETNVRVLVDVGQIYEYGVTVRAEGPRYLVTSMRSTPAPLLPPGA